MDPKADPNTVVLGNQVENLHARVGGMEKQIESVSAAVTLNANQTRQEFQTAHHALRQEVSGSIGGMKQEMNTAITGVLAAVKELGGSVADKQKTQWPLLIMIAGLGLTVITSVGVLYSRSYDLSIAKIEKKLDDHDSKIVPRSEITLLQKNIIAWTNRFNLRVDRLATYEREDAINGAVLLDRAHRKPAKAALPAGENSNTSEMPEPDQDETDGAKP